MREISVALLHVEQEQISKDEKIAIIENEAIGYPGDFFFVNDKKYVITSLWFWDLKKACKFLYPILGFENSKDATLDYLHKICHDSIDGKTYVHIFNSVENGGAFAHYPGVYEDGTINDEEKVQ